MLHFKWHSAIMPSATITSYYKGNILQQNHKSRFVSNANESAARWYKKHFEINALLTVVCILDINNPEMPTGIFIRPVISRHFVPAVIHFLSIRAYTESQLLTHTSTVYIIHVHDLLFESSQGTLFFYERLLFRDTKSIIIFRRVSWFLKALVVLKTTHIISKTNHLRSGEKCCNYNSKI